MDSQFQSGSTPDQPIAQSNVDLLDLPESHQKVLRVILRARSATLSAIAAALQENEATVAPIVQALVKQGFVEEEWIANEPHYRSHLTTRRPRKLSSEIWQKLEDPEDSCNPNE